MEVLFLKGLIAYEKCYASISPRLDLQINPSIALDALPQKTNDAISYGVVKSIIMLLEVTCKDKRIFFTGGDGKFFLSFSLMRFLIERLFLEECLKLLNKHTWISKKNKLLF